MIFLELFYNSTVVLSGVYYPTAPLVLHHMLDMAEHLQNAERDANFRMIATPMKLKFLKYWEKIPLIYSYALSLNSLNIGRKFHSFIHMHSFLILELR